MGRENFYNFTTKENKKSKYLEKITPEDFKINEMSFEERVKIQNIFSDLQETFLYFSNYYYHLDKDKKIEELIIMKDKLEKFINYLEDAYSNFKKKPIQTALDFGSFKNEKEEYSSLKISEEMEKINDYIYARKRSFLGLVTSSCQLKNKLELFEKNKLK
ncbi:MAG: hypothetical protein WC928_04255 [Patescibacteria group bacterium]|jgi:hypothetical protein